MQAKEPRGEDENLQRSHGEADPNIPVLPTRRESPWPMLVLSLSLAVAAVLIVRVVFIDLPVPEIETESQAVTASADRLVQLAQWTIGIVLSVGGLFVGFNWYQSETRYQRDREEVKREVDESRAQINHAVMSLDEFRDHFDARLKMVENLSIANTDSLIGQIQLDAEDSRSHPLKALPEQFIARFRRSHLPLDKRGSLWALGAAISREANRGALSSETAMTIMAFIPDAEAFDAVWAHTLQLQLGQAARQMEWHRESGPPKTQPSSSEARDDTAQAGQDPQK